MMDHQAPEGIDLLLSTAGGARAIARCDFLGRWPYSDHKSGLFRPFLGQGFEASATRILEWMREAGMEAAFDPACNIIGRYEGLSPDAPAFMIGSHIDSVRDAGHHDGMLGVMLGIELVDTFHKAGRRFPFALEVMGFGDEEGSRFPTYMLGSRALAGLLPPHALNARDPDGMSIAEALAEWDVDPNHFATARRAPETLIGYLEPHIEQAPYLYEQDLPLAVVSSIAAQSRFYVTLTGQAAHAGSAMKTRRDALSAAAEMMLAIERTAQAGPDDLVATCGAFTTDTGPATNIVAGEVTFSIDLRAAHRETRDSVAVTLLDALQSIADRRHITMEFEERHNLPGATCDPTLSYILAESGRDVTGAPLPFLVSQAGHDGMNVAAIAPISMVFIRCEKGISHNPAEAVRAGDVALALETMRRFIERLELFNDGKFEFK